MSYKILEAKIIFTPNGNLKEIFVLVDMNLDMSDVRAMYQTNKPNFGYGFLKATAKFSAETLQDVAGYGEEHHNRDEIFPFWRIKNYD